MEGNHSRVHRLPRGAFVMNPVHLLLAVIAMVRMNQTEMTA